MTTTQSNVSAARPLRLWPGIIIVAAVWAARLAAPAVLPGPIEELMVRGFSSLGGTLAIAIWWLLFSRASQRERWAIAGVMVAAASVPLVLGHESIGVFWLVMYALPMLCLALVLSAAAARGLPQRRTLMGGAILIAGLPWTGVRIAGINGAGGSGAGRQPAVRQHLRTATGGFHAGVRRMDVAEAWTSNGLKPYFSDFVIHQGYAYGFDGAILAAVNLQDGVRAWKGGRYGQGQLVLLPDQDALLVLSEEGELVLVRATPERFMEIARTPGITGKTWNHPVVVGDLLLVRNGEEMAAFRLPAAER